MLMPALSRVWPSGAAFATISVPTMLPAPGRLSTMTGFPSDWASPSATIREVRSLPPPGANGATNRIGFDGYSWAVANGDSKADSNRIAGTFRVKRGIIPRSTFIPQSASADVDAGRPRLLDEVVPSRDHVVEGGEGVGVVALVAPAFDQLEHVAKVEIAGAGLEMHF